MAKELDPAVRALIGRLASQVEGLHEVFGVPPTQGYDRLVEGEELRSFLTQSAKKSAELQDARRDVQETIRDARTIGLTPSSRAVREQRLLDQDLNFDRQNLRQKVLGHTVGGVSAFKEGEEYLLAELRRQGADKKTINTVIRNLSRASQAEASLVDTLRRLSKALRRSPWLGVVLALVGGGLAMGIPGAAREGVEG